MIAPAPPKRRALPKRCALRCAIALAAPLLLIACTRQDDAPAAGGLTVGESATLDKAADRLDQRPPPPGKADADALEAQIRDRLAAEQREAATQR